MAQMIKNPPANAGDLDPVPVWERSPGGGNDNPLQYASLENGQRSQAGGSPWGHKESHTTERLTLSRSHKPFLPLTRSESFVLKVFNTTTGRDEDQSPYSVAATYCNRQH